MKFYNKTISSKMYRIYIVLFLIGLVGCNNFNDLSNVPKDSFVPENIFTSEAGYEAAVVDLYVGAREEIAVGGQNFDYMNLGTDLVQWGRRDSRGFKDYTLLNPQYGPVGDYWSWAYERMIKQSNLILDNIKNSEIEIDESTKSSFSGQAKFFRAWTYNILVNLYGGVPIVKEVQEARFDFQRATKEETLQFIRTDLEEATQSLPIVENASSNARIYKAAAYHLLTEVYISLGRETGDPSYYDMAVDAASMVIDREVGNYQLMRARFGDLSREGDVFSDLFWTNQQSRSSGNLEVIWSLQFENFTEGGGSSVGGNHLTRLWQPEYEKIITPNGVSNLATDSLQRGIGVNSPTNYLKYGIWQLDPNDMRNSRHNIRREFYYNNPADPDYFGKKIRTAKDSEGNLVVVNNEGNLTDQTLDTLRVYYPWIRKTDGIPYEDNVVNGQTANDFIKMRLAETYLLRAEAYIRNGNLNNAAQDINAVRDRANATQIDPNDVTIDFILDERARELVMEEPRRRTLQRMGKLYERVKKYNPTVAPTIQPHNELWPIPQDFIDANTEVSIEQNPGY